MTLLHRLAALCLLAMAAFPALAINEKDLLPVDQAFVLTAQAPERGRIALHWKIADGYYLYRHRIAVRVESGFKANPTLQLPAGHKKTDPYFGEVETYRGQLSAVQTGAAASGVDTLQVEVRYQGCADAGVCYPPQKRLLSVALPAEETGAAAAASSPLPGSGPGNAGPAAKPLFGAGANAVQGLPLPSDQAFGFEAIVGDGNTLLLRFTPAPGYYLYRDRTALALEGAAGIRTGMPQWPQGRSHKDEHFGNVVVYFDQAEVTVPLQRQRADAAEATLVATFQGCQSEGICYPPMTRRVKLSLPKGKVSPDGQAEVAPLLVTPLNSSQADASAAAADTATPVTAADAATPPDASVHNAARSTAPQAEPQNLLWMLLLALGGGLVLNLLPCVLPILSLKVLGVAQSGESRSRARSHALWYTLGVLVSFAVVGGIAVAARLLWGFQLQRPGFVAVLVYLMFVVGLSLSGVFTLSANLGGLGQSLSTRSGPVGDFFTGVLACVVSSACIGPFMGPALGYALTAPPAMAMLVFLTLGLGLALPFLLIGFVPSLARRLPKPGAWMETLKQVLAFPMYLTAIWLLWVLGKQRGVDAVALLLVGATLLALGLWWFERARWRGHKAGMRLASVLLLLALVPAWGVTRLPAPGATVERNTVAYSPEMLDRLRTDNRVVFVNMTADWCVTCKANERNVFSGDAFRDTLKRVDAVYMKGDWTNEDQRISAFLAEHKAVGVPLYVVYGPGAPPTVLPPVLSQAVVEDALLRAAR
ncbi:protein-disulfide reductase DsbD [Xanthomonas sp. NCPPB 2654]|uniref:protein-disulfide reductase DsbD family protein n=1 Tax=unclassified Xanthomonas TaxID=2643310 RepID=UPI0021E0099A|nr:MULTISPECIES: protein-disulfide reductase DsbD [unclassified Xanthomonas]MDL5367523.1 protein-disulfide reductase DsbD [Xanthomonas sp. NCPPB 2654]UYC21264.1 protein-disulfide reductase DsbD [Xanthomonas sp. CFBP 8443]